MNVLKKYGTAIPTLLLFGVLVGFTEQNHARRSVQRLEVGIDPAAGGPFVTARELLMHVDAETDSFRGVYFHEINNSLLEENLSGHPMVETAEVYFELNGTLHLDVNQREPMLRIFDGERSFYWDTNGCEMPLSDHYTAHVPLFYGTPSDTATLYDLVMALRADEFCREHISGIAETNGDYVLTVRRGQYEIVLGSAERFGEKMHRFRLFYEKALPQMGWDRYSKVNLKYAGQVVCTVK